MVFVLNESIESLEADRFACKHALTFINMRLMLVVIFSALVCSFACDRGSNQKAVQLKFVFKKEYDGELKLNNESTSPYPLKLSDGSLVIEIDPDKINSYNRSRFPDLYIERAAFGDGTPIETNSRLPAAKYYFGFSSWDEKGNMTIEIHKKK